ncbi:MAG: hypothetical protein ACK4MV_09145 [Beijerinckiaceae bacterium]
MSKPVFTYWEGPVSWLERVCIASIQDAGHQLTVYTADLHALQNAGLGAPLADVRDALPEASVAYRYREQMLFSYFADIARLALLRQGAGIWADADCLFLTPLSAPAEYILGSTGRRKVNNAVLLMPHDSPALREYFDAITSEPMKMPWATLRRRFLRYMASLRSGGALQITHNSIGPRALTYYVRKHRLWPHVSPPQRFYPVSPGEVACLIDPDDRAARAKVESGETQIVHTWHNSLGVLRALDSPPPPTSYLGQHRRRLGV